MTADSVSSGNTAHNSTLRAGSWALTLSYPPPGPFMACSSLKMTCGWRRGQRQSGGGVRRGPHLGPPWKVKCLPPFPRPRSPTSLAVKAVWSDSVWLGLWPFTSTQVPGRIGFHPGRRTGGRKTGILNVCSHSGVSETPRNSYTDIVFLSISLSSIICYQ